MHVPHTHTHTLTHMNDVCNIKRFPELLKLIMGPRIRTSELLGAYVWGKEEMKKEGVSSSLQFPRVHWERPLNSKYSQVGRLPE